MKKVALFFLFMLSLNAYAENWKYVIASDNQEIYVDVDSIATVGKYRRAWSIFNYSVSARAPGTKFDFISDRSLFFFDCKKRRYGRATQILYSKPNGAGESDMTFSGKISDIKFEKVEKETIGENFFDFVCTHSIN
ncbi:hypothetical protein NB640_03395 [Oxalobacter vibrioformis]|uniref:Surface-adhesin protein E-like domain-containing protein n=1 Tax=Oxalobacter vibrioformis TaxID=933080 RepID=A0A9E9LXW3_9BURK|nr:surface-adhesin E family protein [Oxalobacter vibrioformis]WAW10712.1 hypothetical protein NB640_03395 [Oxalobacter vibrioformis]